MSARALARAPIYNKMKAIRGDNPRTTNQRVYLMPVVPSPPPEKPPDARRGTVFSLSFPPALHLFHIGMPLFYLSIRSSPSRFLARRSLFPSLPTPPSRSRRLSRASFLSSILSTPSPLPPPLRSRSRVITLLLSDMSLCYRHNQPRAPLSSRSSSRARARSLTLGRPPRRASPPRYLQRVVRSRVPAI